MHFSDIFSEINAFIQQGPIKWSNETVNTFIMLQKFPISSKTCTSEITVLSKNLSLPSQEQIKIIKFKYIKIENKIIINLLTKLQ